MYTLKTLVALADVTFTGFGAYRRRTSSAVARLLVVEPAGQSSNLVLVTYSTGISSPSDI
jgi:hypothetical protein